MKVVQLCLTLCNPLYHLWNSLCQNTGVVSLSLLQGIFPTQGSNPGLLHWRQILYQLNYKGRPIHPEESRIERDTCIPMFIASLFTRASPWKQSRCSSADEKMRKLWLLFSVAQSFLTICDSIDCSIPGLPSFTNSRSLLKLMSTKSVMLSKPSHPLSSPSPPAFNLSQHQGLF